MSQIVETEASAALDANNPYSAGQFEADLARVNVLRLRGDLSAAERECRAILGHKPESEQAHALMGDIKLDQGDLEVAAEWFEIAASHAPDSSLLRSRAAAIRQRREEQEMVAAAKRLGMPTSRGKIQAFAATILLIVTAISIVAFILGGQLGNRSRVQTIRDPLELTNAPETEKPTAVPPAVTGFQLPGGDRRLLEFLRGVPSLGDRVLNANTDPRGPRIQVALEAPPGEFTRDALADDAALVLVRRPEANDVTIRYLRDGQALAMADLNRADYERALNEQRPIGSALTSIWPTQETSPPPVGETSPPPDQSVSVPAREEPANPSEGT